MAKIKVAEKVKDKVPQQIQDLEQGWYRLTKTGSKRDRSGVSVSQFEEGELSVIEIGPTGLPGVLVRNDSRWNAYLRTSPIVAVTDQTEDTLSFETEGGFYKLERKQNDNR